MHNQTLRTKLRLILLCTALLISCVWSFFPTLALGTGSISQGFKAAGTNIEAGALVARKTGSQDAVELANVDRANQLIGIVGEKPLVELSGGDKELQVVISGFTQTLVSDINGDIKVGDKIAASPINGVGMKATEETQIIGTAQAALSNADITKRKIADRSGKSQTVRIGLIAAQVDVTYYVPEQSKIASLLPSFLQTIADNTAGKNVSPLRVLVSTMTLLLGFITAAIILYSSVRSGITSIGRNPLARSALLRGLFEVLLTAGGILIITTVIVYLILTS